jgi:membrane AbrB-like protein
VHWLILRNVVAIGLILAGAWAFGAVNAPLPYILGALVGAAINTNLIGPLKYDYAVRRTGVLLIGTSVGATLTHEVLIEFAHLLPLMVLMAICANLISIALVIPTSKIAGVDRLTGLLSCLPAGMAEMAMIARDMGAKDHVVATVQTLRVFIILIIVPIWLGIQIPVRVPPPPLTLFTGVGLALFIVTAATLGYVGARYVFGSWIIAPIVLAFTVVVAGGFVPPLPPLLLIFAQIAIGASVGNRLNVAAMSHLPRAVAAGLFSGTILVGISFTVLAAFVSYTTGIDYSVALLSVAPGGMGEMIAAAKSLGVTSATVASFQLVRSLLTNSFAPPTIRYLWRNQLPKT